MLKIPIALQEQEREHVVPLDIPNEQLDQNPPDLQSDMKGSEGHDVTKHDGQGMVTERSLAVAPGREFDNDQLGEDAHRAVRSGGSEGEWWYPGNILSTNIHQIRREPWETRWLWLPLFLVTSQWNLQMDSALSKPFLQPSPPFMLITGLAYDPYSLPFSNEPIRRKPQPLETKSKTSSHARSRWRHSLPRSQVT